MVTEFDNEMKKILETLNVLDGKIYKAKKYRNKLYDKYCFLRCKRIKKYGQDILNFDLTSDYNTGTKGNSDNEDDEDLDDTYTNESYDENINDEENELY